MDVINRPRALRGLFSRSAFATLGAAALTLALAGQVSAAPFLASVASAPNFAGYYAAPSEGIASVSATLTIPTITCSDDNTYLDDLGIGIQNTLYSVVVVSCDGSGNASYGVALTVDGGTPFVPNPSGFNPGDTVVASVFQTTSRQEAEIHDVTNGVYWYDYSGPGGALSAVFIGAINNDTTPPFATVAFTKVQINGLYLGEESPTQYNARTGHITLITASKLSRPGDNFKLTFKNEAY